jgi:hypothetical protein
METTKKIGKVEGRNKGRGAATTMLRETLDKIITCEI